LNWLKINTRQRKKRLKLKDMTPKHYFFYFIIINTLTGAERVSTTDASIGKDYDLKSELLYRLVDYVNWPNFSTEQSFKIAVLESSRITASLRSRAKNKKINVKEYKTLKEIRSCQILFIPYNCTIPVETVLSNFSGKQVLIVTEKRGYGKKGAHLNFVTIESKLRFEVNIKAINKAGITISSFLLQHAIIVE
jgi:hypothetical protein